MKTSTAIKTLFFLFFLLTFSYVHSQTNEWTWMKGDTIADQHGAYGAKGTASEKNKPGARLRAVTWTDASNNLWLFGGYGYSSASHNNIGDLNDLWKYDINTNQWTWMNGDNKLNSKGVYGEKGIPSEFNTPCGRESSAAWTDGSGNFWLFGGFGRGSFLNDLWKYDIQNNTWTWIKGDSVKFVKGVYGVKGLPSHKNKPGGRERSINWLDSSGNLWLFGGSGYSSDIFWGDLNDLWKYNIKNNTWTWIGGDTITEQEGIYGVKRTASKSNKPGARYGGAGWTDTSGKIWLFGGIGTGWLNDLWRYNIKPERWVWVSGDSIIEQRGKYGTKNTAAKGAKPGARYFCNGLTDKKGNFWLFGGYGYATQKFPGTLNDLWKFDVFTKLWKWVGGDNVTDVFSIYGTQGIASPDNKPGGRSASASWVDTSGNFWIFGGSGYRLGLLNDLWKFNPGDGSSVHTATELNHIHAATVINKLNAVLQPNPTASSFVLKVQTAGKEDINITVYNSAGNIAQQLKANPQQQIYFGDNLPAGTYFVEIRQGKLSTTLKAVKQ